MELEYIHVEATTATTAAEALRAIDRTSAFVRRTMQKIPKGQIVITWKDASVTIDVTEKGVDPLREP